LNCFCVQSKNIVLEKTVEYVTEVNEQLKAFGDLQQREQKLGKKFTETPVLISLFL